MHLAGTRYYGVNHTHLSELLSEREGIHMGRTTLRRILLDSGLQSSRRRRPPKHRVRRQRMPRAGMLVQLDGSYHQWLGDNSPPFTLLLAVDDATGEVVNALFCNHEDSRSYFLLMQNLLRLRGIPLAIYTDRHAVFKHKSEYRPTGTPTQFGRAMEELGIQMIFALSPQAKGRVERASGTFQDRLITELRLAGATTMEQAKAVLKQFLPRFNRRFQVPAQCPDTAFRPLLIDDNKECLPVASPKNVTETLALGIRSKQVQFRQSSWFRRACVGRSINEIFGHDAPPIFHPALQGSQLRFGETVRVFRLQPCHQRLARGIRLCLQPPQHVAPNALEGVLARAPMPRTSHSRGVCGTCFALPPQIGQLGEEPFEAFSCWRFPHTRRRGCHQRRLGFTDGVQQQHRVQPSPIFLK